MRDIAYHPGKVISDIYSDLDSRPYLQSARIAYNTAGPATNSPKTEFNYHSYTYVGPLIGPSLSPDERHLYKYKETADSLVDTKPPSRVTAMTVADLEKVHKDAISFSTSILPLCLALIGSLLVFYASIVTPPSQLSGNNPLSGINNNGRIIDNRH